MQHGPGVMTFPNGIKIEGNFVEGSPDDNSTVYYPDNTKYVGERKGILPHGQGKLTRPDGTIEEG